MWVWFDLETSCSKNASTQIETLISARRCSSWFTSTLSLSIGDDIFSTSALSLCNLSRELESWKGIAAIEQGWAKKNHQGCEILISVIEIKINFHLHFMNDDFTLCHSTQTNELDDCWEFHWALTEKMINVNETESLTSLVCKILIKWKLKISFAW